MDVNNLNALVIAYLGDNVYEYYVRRALINRGISNVNNLQTESTKYVSAKSQSEIVNNLINENFFTEDELDIYKRARNHKGNRHPKNCDIVTYKCATGLEAIIGYLEFNNKRDRIETIMKRILGE